MKAYLAGPDVFYRNTIPRTIAAKLTAICETYGIQGFFPLDKQVIAPPGVTQDQAIFDANIEMMKNTDIIFANMMPFRGPGMDGGTAFEMGYFHALGKPIIGYNAGPEYREKCKDLWSDLAETDGELIATRDDMCVENFGTPDNLMMVRSALYIGADFEDAARWAAANLKTRN